MDSLAKPDAGAVSYSIRSADPAKAEDSVRFREAAALVKTALSGRGLYEAPANTVPDVIVDLDCGVKLLRTQSRVISEPVWDTTPPKPPRIVERAVGGEIYVERMSEPTKVTVRQRTVTDTIYEKYLRLTARENTASVEGRPVPEVWTVDVVSEGESKDLRKHLPVLIGASIDYIGKDSHGQQTIRIKDTDADVAYLKKGM